MITAAGLAARPTFICNKSAISALASGLKWHGTLVGAGSGRGTANPALGAWTQARSGTREGAAPACGPGPLTTGRHCSHEGDILRKNRLLLSTNGIINKKW